MRSIESERAELRRSWRWCGRIAHGSSSRIAQLMSHKAETVAAWKRCTRSALSSTTRPLWRPASCVATPVGHISVWHLSDWTQPSENMKARAAFDQSAPSAQLTASPARSEEHTSELQSLMRISYALLCFKTKNKRYN